MRGRIQADQFFRVEIVVNHSGQRSNCDVAILTVVSHLSRLIVSPGGKAKGVGEYPPSNGKPWLSHLQLLVWRLRMLL